MRVNGLRWCAGDDGSRYSERGWCVMHIRLLSLTLFAMTTALAQTEFEAASVKRLKPVVFDASQPSTLVGTIPMMKGGPGSTTPGRIRYSNVTLKSLILKAYEF